MKTKKKIDPFKVRKSRKESTSKAKVKMPKVSELTLARDALKLMIAIDELKLFYQQLDEITQQLVDQNFESITIGKYRVVLKDNFAVKNLAWKSTPMRRYQLEIG